MESEHCYKCKNTELIITDYEIICNECGLIQNVFISNSSSNLPFVDDKSIIVNHNKNFSKDMCKIQKMLNWYTYTKDEKNDYKLSNYTRTLCNKLNTSRFLTENIIVTICNTVIHIINVIKKYDGTKRAKVKDGIIVVCIEYVTKTHTDTMLSSTLISKQLDLDIKYISKAEKIILELVSMMRIDKKILIDTIQPYDCVVNIIKKYSLNISDIILSKLNTLIKLCEENDLLLDNMPLSIGVSCFYYILKKYSIDIDIKVFCELYSISVVTVIKTFNKLKIQLESIKLDSVL